MGRAQEENTEIYDTPEPGIQSPAAPSEAKISGMVLCEVKYITAAECCWNRAHMLSNWLSYRLEPWVTFKGQLLDSVCCYHKPDDKWEAKEIDLQQKPASVGWMPCWRTQAVVGWLYDWLLLGSNLWLVRKRSMCYLSVYGNCYLTHPECCKTE